MDILTQGLLGAVMAQTRAKPEETRQACTIGFLSGLMADADVLIRSSTDPLLMLEYHRHFTHSIFFIPFGALLVALLLSRFYKGRLTWNRVYLFSLMGFSLSGAIDACTSYGTYLFWPFVDERISLSIISIVDPFFTISLLAALLYGWFKFRPRPAAYLGLSLCGLYLALGLVQQQRAMEVMESLASARGHEIQQAVVKPTLGNIILWRTTYIADNRIYADGIRVSITGNTKIFPGDSVPVFKPEHDLQGIGQQTVLYQDVVRFTSLSDGYIAFYPGSKNILGD
ncbi:MAG: metal-dependent hydrolase, partial [Gammaproteobacteria bacterium]|nr:metal-dependent hydrolase [Gammaproteobacteria bacterium]